MPVEHDPFTQIVNVQWEEEGGFAFLYSGADGMFGSSDGQTWKAAPSSKPAASLAWVDDVFVGCGPDGCWRSDDGAQTWTAVDAPAFVEVAAMKPKGVGLDDKPKPGVFAGWLEDDAGDNYLIYVSHDLGQSWSVGLTIPKEFGDSGSESIEGLSGCGGALFVCTSWHSETFHAGDGKIYSSTDGVTFSPATVFGPGSTITPEDPDQFPRKSFSANAVGYDADTERYIAIGDREIIPAFGVQESYLIYTTSTSSTFGTSDGTVHVSATQTAGVGEFLSVGTSAAGGDGKHVTGFDLSVNATGGVTVSTALKASFIPGLSETLLATGGIIGSFCFRSFSESSTDEGTTDQQGIFACTAFGADRSGGVYVADETSGGHFARTHIGTAILDINGDPRGAVAVGIVGFLEQGTA